MTTQAFGPLAVLRERPIPDQSRVIAQKSDSRSGRVDAADSRNREALVDLASLGIAGQNYYSTFPNPPYYCSVEGSIDELWLRKGAALKLAAINRRLDPVGLELWVYDGWRPRAVQQYFHDVWMPAELKRRNPALEGEALWREVEMYWAAPSTDASPAPHETGGAVDLTIRWKDGDKLWMGSIFDDLSALAHLDRFERAPSAEMSFSDDEARANRRLLYWLMTEEGFAQNPYEWWHYAYGDLMWATLHGAPASFYAATAPISYA